MHQWAMRPQRWELGAPFWRLVIHLSWEREGNNTKRVTARLNQPKSYSILILYANLLEHNSKSNECENVEAPITSVQLATMSECSRHKQTQKT